MAESITNKKIISFAGRNIDLDEFIRRALARAVEWMDYQGLKGDERTDFLNSFNTRLLNIVSGQSSNSETPSTTIAVGGSNSNDGTNYYNKDGERKQDNKPRGGIFGTVRRNGFNPELNVDTYLNGIAGTIPTIEELESAKKLTTSSTALKPFNQNTMRIYVGNSIFGEGNPTSNEQLAKWIDAYDKQNSDGTRPTEGRKRFIDLQLLQYRKDLLDGKYDISEEDKAKEIEKIDKLTSSNIPEWEIGKYAPWMSGLLQNPAAKLTTATKELQQTTPLETIVEEATEAPARHDLLGENAQVTDVDKARFYSILGDIGSAAAAYFGPYGTIASAVTGVGATGLGAYADFNDNTVTSGEAWLNTGLGLGADVIGLLPGIGSGAKAYKITKALAKIPWNSLMKMARGIGISVAGKDALLLIYDKAVRGETLNSDDLKKLKTITSVGSGEARVHAAKRATQRVLQSAKKVEGITVNTSKGRKVVDNKTAKELSEAKTKALADEILKKAAKNNPDLEGAESVFKETRVSMTPWKKKDVNFTNPGRKPVTNPDEVQKPGGYLDINPQRGLVYDFSNVKQRSGWFGRNFSDEAIVARRVDAVNYPGRPDYKAKLNENPATKKENISEKITKAKERKKKLDMKSATRAVEKGNTISLEKHINKATGITLDKTNPNSKVNLKTAIEDLKKAGHTNEEISNMLTNKRFTLALKEHYKFREGGVIPKFGDGTNGSWFDWIVKIFGGPSTAGSGFQPYNSAAVTGRVTGSGGKKVNTRTEKVTSSKKEPSTTSGAEPATTSQATSTVPPSNKPETKPEAKPENKPEDKPQSGKLEGTVGGLQGTVGEDEYKPTVDRPGGYNNETSGRSIGNPSDLTLTGIELGKFLGSMWANNAILNKYKQLRPYHRINPQQAYRIWSPKPLADLAEKARTDANQLGALLARGTNDQGLAAAYRITSHFKGEDAARPYDLQYNADIKESVNTALNIQNDNQEKRVDRVNDNHKADVAKFNQDRFAEIQRLHDNSTKLQQLGATMQNGIARGALAQYENDYRSFLSSDPEIVRARTAYRNAKARYDANPNDNSAQRELTNAENALNNIITDKSNYWQSAHRLSLGYPFGPVIWTSPVVQSRPSFFAKGGNLEVVDKVERGRMKRHYDKLYYNAHKLLVTESNKKQRAMANGYGYLLKLMMQSK